MSVEEQGGISLDISGGWNGMYAYGGRHRQMQGAGFSALFTVTDSTGGFVGAITDANSVGEAGAAGTVEGRALRFVKTYRWSLFTRTAPVHYEGEFSGDAQAVQGTWRVNSRLFGFLSGRAEGTWRMQRPGLPEMQIVWPPPPQVSKR